MTCRAARVYWCGWTVGRKRHRKCPDKNQVGIAERGKGEGDVLLSVIQRKEEENRQSGHHGNQLYAGGASAFIFRKYPQLSGSA